MPGMENLTKKMQKNFRNYKGKLKPSLWVGCRTTGMDFIEGPATQD